MFREEYAPRAAIYEALPSLLLRLAGPSEVRKKRPASPVWMRFSGGVGSYEPGRSTVGAAYDFGRTGAEAGLTVSLGEDAEGWISVRRATAAADISSPAGRGRIEAVGIGPAIGAAWRGMSGYYACGAFSLTFLDMDLSSDKRGLLKARATGLGHSLALEAGRSLALNAATTLVLRARVTRSKLSVDGFTDAVNARVWFSDTDRVTGGLGLAAESSLVWKGGELSLRGSLDIERTLSGAETAAYVSGEKLISQSAKNRIHAGLGIAWRRDGFNVGAEAAAMGVGSSYREVSGRLTLGMQF